MLDGCGTVLDCNGAALLFFKARCRSQLCNRPRFLLQELVPATHLEAFKQRLGSLLGKGAAGGQLQHSAAFEAAVYTFKRTEVGGADGRTD